MAEISKNNRNIFWFAGIFIIVGFGFGILLFKDYFSPPYSRVFFDENSRFQDLATSLAGTTGLLWTLGSIIFFVYTLIQTREEINLQISELSNTRTVMTAQLDAINKQQVDTTFFHLLANHRSMVERLQFSDGMGYRGLETVTRLSGIEINHYGNSLINGCFPVPSMTDLYPEAFLRTFNAPIVNICESISQIVNLIELRLEKNQIYHEILYNYLTPGEKFILGLCLKNEFFTFNKSILFNYSDFFERTSVYRCPKEDWYFPNIKIKKTYPNDFELDNEFKCAFLSKSLSFEIKIIGNNRQNHKLYLNSIGIYVNRTRIDTYLPNEKHYTLKDKLLIEGRTIIDLWKHFKSLIWDIIRHYFNGEEKNNGKVYRIDYLFNFSFEGINREISVGYWHEIRTWMFNETPKLDFQHFCDDQK